MTTLLCHKLDQALAAALKGRDGVRAAALRLLKQRAADEASRHRRATPTDGDVVAAAVGWRRRCRALLASYLAYGAAGEPHADRLVADIAACEVVLPSAAGRDELRRVATSHRDRLGLARAAGKRSAWGLLYRELGGNFDLEEARAVLDELYDAA